MTGQQVRAASRPGLPAPVRLLSTVVFIAVCALGGAVAGRTGRPEVALLVFVPAFAGYVVLLRRATTHRRRSWGMVRVTAAQFDLLVALGQVPPDRVDSARQTHDQLIWLLQQPAPDQEALSGWESWGWQLAGGGGAG